MLADISLVNANFGNARAYRDVMLDWFEFLGGKPGEVVVVDGGSDRETRDVYWRMFDEGLIDKLQIIQPSHAENHKDRCFIQEYRAGDLASKPYLLWMKADTLPWREGHDDWIRESIQLLDRSDTFAVSGSFNIRSKVGEEGTGWYRSDKCSENFALMKSQRFRSALEEYAGPFIRSGFTGVNPASETGQARYLVEVAFERYMAAHGMVSLVRLEDPTWTVFHTNCPCDRLPALRERYRARRGIETAMNAGLHNARPGRGYYGRAFGGRIRDLRVRFGASVFGPWWRRLKSAMRQG